MLRIKSGRLRSVGSEVQKREAGNMVLGLHEEVSGKK